MSSGCGKQVNINAKKEDDNAVGSWMVVGEGGAFPRRAWERSR